MLRSVFCCFFFNRSWRQINFLVETIFKNRQVLLPTEVMFNFLLFSETYRQALLIEAKNKVHLLLSCVFGLLLLKMRLADIRFTLILCTTGRNLLLSCSPFCFLWTPNNSLTELLANLVGTSTRYLELMNTVHLKFRIW